MNPTRGGWTAAHPWVHAVISLRNNYDPFGMKQLYMCTWLSWDVQHPLESNYPCSLCLITYLSGCEELNLYVPVTGNIQLNVPLCMYRFT